MAETQLDLLAQTRRAITRETYSMNYVLKLAGARNLTGRIVSHTTLKAILVNFALLIALSFPVNSRADDDILIYMPAILAGALVSKRPHCDTTYPGLCTNKASCYYASVYWYSGTCNARATTDKNKTILLVDGSLRRFKNEDVTFYKAEMQGKECTNSPPGTCNPIDVSWTVNPHISFSPSAFSDESLPSLLQNRDSFSGTKHDIAQDSSLSLKVFHAFTNNHETECFHGYPDGVVWLKSPLQKGVSWSFEYAPETVPGSSIRCPYALLTGYFLVVNVEIVDTLIGKIETVRIAYSVTRRPSSSSFRDALDENGYIWVHPKIGIIEKSYQVRDYNSTGFADIYNKDQTIHSTSIPINHLPRN
jgi:hypothetical protein